MTIQQVSQQYMSWRGSILKRTPIAQSSIWTAFSFHYSVSDRGRKRKAGKRKHGRKRERITAEITALKSLLTESDYQLIKMLENLAGCTSILDILAVFKSFLTDFGELVNDRKTWRENINTLEAELEQLDTETALENKVAE